MILEYSMSNVILVDEKLTSFHRYICYCHKCVPMCSVCQVPSYGPNLTLLALFSAELAYLSMLFILEMIHTACSADHLKNKEHAQMRKSDGNHASNVKLDS